MTSVVSFVSTTELLRTESQRTPRDRRLAEIADVLCRWHAALVLALVVLVGCDSATVNSEALYEITGPTMGTRYSVKVVVEAADTAEQLKEAIDERLVEINNLMSTYIESSELSRFNSNDSLEPMPISRETAVVVSASLELAKDSGGAFDPTVGPLVDIWGFGPKGQRTRPPSDDEIADAREVVGYEMIELDATSPSLSRTNAGVELNLSAIAKGYGVDAICELLEASGVDAYMVEIGGEVRVRGKKPDGSAWKLGVERPDEQGRSASHILKLTTGALATSGDYRNFFEYEGQRYSHTINPATGRPVTHSLATVSVYTSDCMSADGLATTLLVLGPDDGYNWAEERRIAALFVERDRDSVRERATTAWTTKFGPLESEAKE